MISGGGGEWFADPIEGIERRHPIAVIGEVARQIAADHAEPDQTDFHTFHPVGNCRYLIFKDINPRIANALTFGSYGVELEVCQIGMHGDAMRSGIIYYMRAPLGTNGALGAVTFRRLPQDFAASPGIWY